MRVREGGRRGCREWCQIVIVMRVYENVFTFLPCRRIDRVPPDEADEIPEERV